MEVKPPKTYEEQINILRGRGCVVTDVSAASDFLRKVNYYRLSGYLAAFKEPDGTYTDGTSFEDIASIYTFDQSLRGIIIKAVSEIEISSKSIIAYYHGHHYGSLGYMDSANFNERHNHKKFIQQFDATINNKRDDSFVRHHLKKYGGKFPVWVAVELFTMGMISIFYADLFTGDRRAIAKEFNTDYIYLESWLHSSTVLRNICAHHGRLYNVRFHQSPRLPRKYAKYANMELNSLFKQLYMLKLLYSNWREEWNNSIVSSLSALLENHGKSVDLKTMGLPANWEDILMWK